jgi:acetolactate synthase I/II/III large subunit
LKLSDYVVNFLIKNNVKVIFGYQGGAITHLIDSISKSSGIRFVSNYHEQASAFAAEGYARISGNFGVAIATSGPGATNLITGIGSAYFDSIPCIYITGQVNTYEYKNSEEIRQVGFQETDIVSIVKPITKYSIMITEASMIQYVLEKSLYLAKSGRPGPVLIDIPMDLQRAEIDERNLLSFFNTSEYKETFNKNYDLEKIDLIIPLIEKSKRPVILVGGGVRLANAAAELVRFSELTGIPVVSTLMGIDCMDHFNENYSGFIGAYGNRYANLTIANCDLLIVLGSRLTYRQTSNLTESFARDAKIVHVDIDRNELNRKLNEALSIYCDIRIFLVALIEELLEKKVALDFKPWFEIISKYKNEYPSFPTQEQINSLDPNEFMYRMSELVEENTIICLDIGQNQIWASQSWKIKKNQRLLNAGGMGSMGYSLPAAIGAYMANPNYRVISISGDGGIQMNIQELQTIVREKLPIKIIIINNKSLGMIRHFQELYFDANYCGTIDGYKAPEFIEIASAYGIRTYKISRYEDMDRLEVILKDDYAYVIEVELNTPTYVIPKLGLEKPIEDQEPLLKREELKNNMLIKLYSD